MKAQYIIALLLIRLTEVVLALHNNGNFTVLTDAIPQIAELSSAPHIHPGGLGTMNITRCCLRALTDAFEIKAGYLVITDPAFLSPGTTPESFLSDIDNGRIPCTATGPEIKASYTWCSINCTGWTKPKPDDAQKWVSPLIQFILPCLVFSTTIPRRRRLQVSDILFKPTLHDIYRLMLTPIRFLFAVIIVTTDVLIWLALCFAFAGPMILSGVFEAVLDSRILGFVERRRTKDLTKLMSTRLLYIILVGNLDFRWSAGKSIPSPPRSLPLLIMYRYREELRWRSLVGS